MKSVHVFNDKMRVIVMNPPSKKPGAIRDLVYGCWCKGRRIGGAKAPPLALLSIATILKEEGHIVKLLDAPAERKSLEGVKNMIRDFDVAITSTSENSFDEDSGAFLEFKKENESLITIVFGSDPTFMPDYVLELNSFDIVVRGEPEFIIRDIVNEFENEDDSWKKVRGIGYRDNGKIHLNDRYPLIENLDVLPIPDRKMLPKNVDYFNPLIKRLPYTTMITSRGCSGTCNFCVSPAFYGKKIRSMSVERVIQELEIIESMGYKEVFFRDETFDFYKKRTVEICSEIIKRNINLTWICNSRVGKTDKDTMALMKKAGCHYIKLGVESGVQEVLNNIKKGITTAQTRNTFKIAHEVGLDTHAHIMLGCPGDSSRTINQTIEFVKEIDPSSATFGIFFPCVGTEIYKQLKRDHQELDDVEKLSSACWSGYFNYIFTGMSRDNLEKTMRYAYLKFYIRPSFILMWLKKIKSIEDIKRISIAAGNVFLFGANFD